MGCPARERVLVVFRRPHVWNYTGEVPVTETGPFGTKQYIPKSGFVCIYCGEKRIDYEVLGH